MPMPFLKAVVTETGAVLMNRVQNGEGVMHFTRIGTGNGVFSEEEKKEESLKRRTGLKSIKNYYDISVKERKENAVKLRTIISNQDIRSKETVIREGYYLNEIGVFARIDEGEEVLYSVAVVAGERGDFLPAFTEGQAAQIVQNFYVTVTNEASVSLKVADGAIAFSKDVDGKISGIKKIVDKKLEEVQAFKQSVEMKLSEQSQQTEQKLAEVAEKRFKDLYGLASRTVTISADNRTVTTVEGEVNVTTTMSKSGTTTTLTTVVTKGRQGQEGYEKYTKTTVMTKLSDGRKQVTVNYVKNV